MPAGGALFGNNASRSQNKNLVEFKAGKMTLKGKMVHPDKRKGLLYVYQSDDSLMHFCWKDRTTGTVEDDLIIFPDDCEFKRVPQCTTGRAYVLKFKSSSRKFFFWVQEPKTDKDEENCRRINEVLNNPPTPGSQRSGGDGGDLHNLLNNMSQQQLMQLFGGVGQIGGLSSLLGTMSRPSTSQSARSGSSTVGSASTTSSGSATTTAPSTTTTAAVTTGSTSTPATTTVTTPATDSSKVAAAVTATTTAAAATAAAAATTTSTATTTTTTTPASAAPIQLSDLQNFLSGMNVPQPGGAAQRPDLASALTSESLQSVLGDPALVQALQQHLPSLTGAAGSTSSPPPSEQLRSTLQSPQFQQALSMFSAALQSGQLGPIVQQFEVGAEAVDAANQGNMEEFVKALQKATIAGGKEDDKQPGGDEKRKKKDDAPPDRKDDDEDEGMSMD